MPIVKTTMLLGMVVLLMAACTTSTSKQQPSPNDAGADAPPGPAGCVGHKDCASAVCFPNGSCADPETVAYVDPMGTDNSSCTQAMPCVSLQKALATPHPTIKMTGTTKENVKISKDVTVFAAPDAKLESATPGAVIEIAGNFQVSIFDLQITGGMGPTGAGILVQPGKAIVALERVAVNMNVSGLFVGAGNTATISRSTFDGNSTGIYTYTRDANANETTTINVNQTTISGSAAGGISVGRGVVATITDSTLVNNHEEGAEVNAGGVLNVVHSTIKDNSGWGIFAYQGTLNVKRSTIEGNDPVPGAGGGAPGISAIESAVTVTQSTIANNASGGIGIDRATKFDITNNFVVRNGTASSSIGGIVVSRDPASIPIPGELRFNTIADNHAQSVGSLTGGIDCKGGFAARNNLILRNTGGTGNPPTLGDCGYPGSIINPSFDPAFKSATDYHLTAATPGTPGSIVDQAACDGNDRDIDDDLRPKTGCDVGADEYRP